MGKVAEPVLRLTFVTLEIEVIKNFSAILVRHRENRQAKESGRTLLKAGHQALLPSCVKGQGMHQVGAYQSAFKIVECSPCQALLQLLGKPLYRISGVLDNRKQKYY